MKITFLGTSHGYAEKNRFKSAIHLSVNSNGYIFDVGAPVASLMKNADMNTLAIKGIFITHMHSDHVECLPELLSQFARYRKDETCMCLLPEKEGYDALNVWYNAMHGDFARIKNCVNFQIYKSGLIFENEDIKVKAIPTNHLQGGKYPAYSFIVESENKKILFTGDMSTDFPEYTKLIENTHYNLVVCEMAHSTIEKQAATLSKTDTDEFLITHYHPDRIKGYEEYFKNFPFNSSLAHDGLVIEL